MSLDGKRIVVTRSTSDGSNLVQLLEEQGATVLAVPTIEIEPVDERGPIDDALRRLEAGEFDWVAFTSAHGVEGLLARPEDTTRIAGTKVASVGRGTAKRLDDLGIHVDLIPASYTAEELARALGPGPGSVLLPRAGSVPPTMVEVLRGKGWDPVEVVVYRTVTAEPTGPAARSVAAGDFDVVTFTSASTVNGFERAFGREVLEGKQVACIGPVTAGAATAAGMHVDVVADEHTIPGLVDTLIESVGR